MVIERISVTTPRFAYPRIEFFARIAILIEHLEGDESCPFFSSSYF